MKPLLIYLLQLVIASGILYGYYHLFLRNKKFHQYNRYYLLSATIISIIIPFLQIPFYFTKGEANSSPILKTLKTIYYSGSEDTMVITASTNHSVFSLNILLYILYTLVAAVLLTRIFMSLFKVKRIISANKSENLSGIRFINTTEPGTPFSFFCWLFWNKNIELQSAKGQQIFRHEIFHIQQKHSWDVLFIEFINMILWVNPFFHIIKKEIKAIHEFLADEFASKEEEKWDYAALLLMQALQTKQQLVNPFFHNQIKRRIAMITNSQKTSHRYLRKLLALPLITFAVILVAFTYKNKTAISQQDLTEPLKIVPAARPEPPDTGVLGGDKRFTAITNTRVRKPNSNPLNTSDTSFKAYFSANSIIIHDMFMKDTTDEKLRFTPYTTFTSIKFYKDTSKPLDNILIVIDGKERSDMKSSTDINGMDPNDISSINVLKGASAISKYGDKGKNGVIEITTKKNSAQQEVVIVGYETDGGFPGGEGEWRKYLERNLDGNIPINNNAPIGTYTVVVQFVINTDGSLSDVKALTNHGYGMEEEAVRIIKKGPKWQPAIHDGHPVSFYKKQPITFMVTSEEADVKNTMLKEVVVVGFKSETSKKIEQNTKSNLQEITSLATIYPNPSNNSVTLSFDSKTTGKGKVIISDINGNVKMTIQANFMQGKNNLSVNVSGLVNGTYLVQLVNPDKTAAGIFKMIKQ